MKRTYVVAFAFATAITVWMLSGLLVHKASSDSRDPTANEKTTRSTIAQVRVRHMVAKPERIEVVLRGHTEAKRIVLIKAEMGGRVVEVPVEKGQRVKKGDVLCRLAEDDHEAQLAQAQAMFDKATIDYDGALKLREKNLLSNTSIAAAKAGLENAKANLKSAQVAVARLTMRAPFDAYVEDRPAQLGDLIDRSGVCARLLDESTLLATAQASEREVATLMVGTPVTVQLDTGNTIPGTISFVARTSDPMTRTYRIEATLSTQHAVRDGLTAQITVPLQETMAYRISPAVLALDDAGKVGIRLVNSASKVEFHHVEVIRENASGIWVAGLPPVIDLITVGQEFVAEGDTVQTMPDTSTLFTSDTDKNAATAQQDPAPEPVIPPEQAPPTEASAADQNPGKPAKAVVHKQKKQPAAKRDASDSP